MGAHIVMGLSRFAPIDNPANYNGHDTDLIWILVILGLLLVILLIGLGVTFARNPERELDEWGNPRTPPGGTPPQA
ncbi:hypothetical protein [Leifsonia sp. 21MFCrub1.1]|uniref:hypothetical protein n=1 Tax=Leifsonia sp. 21MFCrub1.1 TaxID=1798223 RepID=UPI000892A018|nr:hypothetical protein [Leifsonia sp. 21MFCrub1.1]SEB12158.1 hypothetical protein SAMN04515680_3443 [Leifsonia sp. 21MFCrub1.1]